MRGIKVTYNNATSKYLVVDLQNGTRLSVARNFELGTDNGYAEAVEVYKAETLSWGVTHYIGNDGSAKYYAIDENGF